MVRPGQCGAESIPRNGIGDGLWHPRPGDPASVGINTNNRMEHRDQSQTMKGIVRACAVGALLAHAAQPTQAQQAVAASSGQVPKPDPWEKWLNPGPFRIRPYGWLNGYYDSNILLTDRDKKDDFIWALNPGVTIATGNYPEAEGSYAVLDYLANVFVFTQGTEDTGWGQNVNLAARWVGGKTVLDFSQGYYGTFGGLLGVTNRVDREFAGRLVDQQVIPTAGQVVYQLSEKTALEADALQLIRLLEEDLNSYNEWRLSTWFSYRVTDKVQTALGGAVGWRDLENNPNQRYEQVLARVRYQLAAKVNALASVGLEWDQWQGGYDQGPFAVFMIGASYQPWENTFISAQGYRRQYPSVALRTQNYLTSGFQVSLQQKIWQRLSASLNAGYDHTSYEPSASGVRADRTDDYFFVGPAVNYSFTTHWDAGLFFNYRRNESDRAGLDYESFQVGFRTAFRF